MKIAVSGAHGFVGKALVAVLRQRGDEVRPLLRPGHSEEEGIAWDPRGGTVETGKLEGLDAIVHLAGAGVAEKRWTEARKREILESRTLGTGLLAKTLAGLSAKPALLISVSAVGYYGIHGDEELDEGAAGGGGFLAEVTRAWEAAAEPARAAGIRVTHPRFAMVLGKGGGALAKMLLPFKLGLGGRFGDGRQYYSWISLDDLVAGLLHLIDNPGAGGIYNFSSPHPVTNTEFTKALGAALHRPTPFPIPAFAARLALGPMADEMLLGGQRVLPARLLREGFRFSDPELGAALKRILA